jgi:hypothetical protein
MSGEMAFERKTELFGLTRGTRHCFRLRARAAAGLGKRSQVVWFIVA